MKQFSKRLDREVQLADMARKSGAVKPVWPEKYVLGGGALGKALGLFRGAKTVVDNAPQNTNKKDLGTIVIGEEGTTGAVTSEPAPVVVVSSPKSTYKAPKRTYQTPSSLVITTSYKKPYRAPLSTVRPKPKTYSAPKTTVVRPRKTNTEPKSANIKPGSTSKRKWTSIEQYKQATGW